MKIIKNKSNMSNGKLKKHIMINKGSAFKAADFKESGVPVVKATNIKDLKITKSTSFLSEDFLISNKKQIIKKQDIILSTVGSQPTVKESAVGQIGFYEWENKALLNQNSILIRTENLNKKYLFYKLTQKDFRFYLDRIATGTANHFFLKVEEIEKYNLCFHKKKEEQEKIATVLSQQEDQVNKIKTLIEKLEKRNQYYAERLLSGELRVREGRDGAIEFYENEEWKEIEVGNKTKLIPATWNKDVLGDLVSVTTGKKNANAGSEKGLYKFFTCSKEDKLINSYSFDQEAILIAGNGIVGLSKYYNGKFDAYQRTYVLGDFKINGKYLFSFINRKFQKAIEKEIKGGVISYIKLENINDFEILYPSNNSELELLMDSLKKLNTELSQAKQLLKKEQKRFDWMSDALLSGEYQVID